MFEDAHGKTLDVVFRNAGETFASYFKRFALIEAHGQTKLVIKLLRERALSEPPGDAGYELAALLSAHVAMFQTAAHHCTRPAVPKAPSVGKYELYASSNRLSVLVQKPISQVMKVGL